jgi:glycosyltransferase involved in cell wall biosynthesis
MTARPRVAVVIPCYNHGRYLDEAVDSVLAQTFQEFEIVVVDDGSDEPETVRLLQSYARPQTRVVHSQNHGLPAARNLGIRETTGEYICALDADDLLEPTCLEKSVRVLDEDPTVAFVSHWLRTFGDETWEWQPERCDLVSLLDRNTVNGAALVRREVVVAVGGFDETLRHGCEDWAFWLEVVSRGFRGAIIPEVLFRYRRRPDSMSRQMMADGSYLGFFRSQFQRYAADYRRHVVELTVAREVRDWELRRAIHDLEAEHREWLEPDVRRWREQVQALRTKVDRVEQRARPAREARARLEQLEAARAADAETARVRIERLEAERAADAETARVRIERLEAERAADAETARARMEHLETQRRGAEAQMANLAAEVAAFRRSVSWRLTAPVRVLGALLLRLRGRPR